MTFGDLCTEYLRTLKEVPINSKRKKKAPSTIEDRERIIRERLKPRWGMKQPLAIKPHEIKAWLEAVQDGEGLENSTIDKIRRVMSLVYRDAQAKSLIPLGEANPVKHVHIPSSTGYEAILVEPGQAFSIICLMKPFERLLTTLIAVTGLRIGEVLALRWKNLDKHRHLLHIVSNYVRGEWCEPKSNASKKPVVIHPIVMGLLDTWRKTTSYGGDDDLIFPSERCKGKQPRVPNMLVEDHLRPAARKVLGDWIDGHRFGFHNLRHGLASFFVEAGVDLKTIQNSLRWADPSILLKTYAHSRTEKRIEAQGLMLDAMGLNEKTARLIQ